MATLEIQVENKAQLANYEAMQCEILFAKGLLDAFKLF